MRNESVVGLRRILHPTDFTEASARAFYHALRLAVGNQSWISLVHVKEAGEGVRWSDFPGVRETLIDWGFLPQGAEKARVGELGMAVRKDVLKGDPVRAIAHYAERETADSIVLSTHARGMLSQLFRSSVAESVARISHLPTLFVPHGVPGFVDAETGQVNLSRVLVPVARQPSPSLAVEAVCRLVESLDCGPVTFRLLYVGEQDDRPHVRREDREDWTWEEVAESGDPLACIMDAARGWEPDLVVMTTAGHDSLGDSLFGSNTEQMVRTSECPVLAVPSVLDVVHQRAHGGLHPAF